MDDLNKSYRIKNVAFDTKREIISQNAKRAISPPSLPRIDQPKGILLLQHVDLETGTRRPKKPLSLSFTEVRTTRTISEDSAEDMGRCRKVDLIHDDWFGLAPLASPESLSEISTISSRAGSFGKMSINTSLERVFFMASCKEETTMGDGDREDDRLVDHVNEERMVTPVVMRRAIKIDIELSKCGESHTEMEKYKRHGKIFITPKVDSVDSVNIRDDDSDSSESDRPNLVGSLTLSRPNAQRVNQLILNVGRRPFVEISCSSSSSCASSITSSLRMMPNEDVMLIDLQAKLAEPTATIDHPKTGATGARSKENVHYNITADPRSSEPQSTPITISESSQEERLASSWNEDPRGGYFQQEPITNKMASGVIESHFPLIMDTPSGQPSPLLWSGGRAKPLQNNDGLMASLLRHSADSSLTNSPSRVSSSVSVQYLQSRPSPTHFIKNRRVHPTSTNGTPPTNPTKVISLKADESNV